jgi:hypothetical protein
VKYGNKRKKSEKGEKSNCGIVRDRWLERKSERKRQKETERERKRE